MTEENSNMLKIAPKNLNNVPTQSLIKTSVDNLSPKFISLQEKLISIKTTSGKNFCMVKPKENSTLHELYENLKDAPELAGRLKISPYKTKIQHHVKQVRSQPKLFCSERHMIIKGSNQTHFVMAKPSKDSILPEIFSNLRNENYGKLSKEIVTD